MTNANATSFMKTAWRMILLWFERKDALVDMALVFMVFLFAVSWLLAPSQSEINSMKLMMPASSANDIELNQNRRMTETALQNKTMKEYESERRARFEQEIREEIEAEYLDYAALGRNEFYRTGPFAEVFARSFEASMPVVNLRSELKSRLERINKQIDEAEAEIASMKRSIEKSNSCSGKTD